MTTNLLPDQFADLEAFARTWVKPSANDRYQLRLDSTMEEMQAFYDAMMARGDALWAYLDQFAYDDMPEQAINVLWLMCALSTVSFACDVFKQPEIPDADGAFLPFTVEPAI